MKLARFTVTGTLGSGSSARVLAALDGERRVALKVSHPHLGQVGRDALLEEARIASGLSHGSLVTPREALVVGESAVVVLELIEGAALEDSMPVSEPGSVVAAVPAVMSGLAKVHAAGFVHRDVHPGNLMLGASNALHLIDFGLVAPVGTCSPGAVGRFGYLSPEQARGEAVDGRADVFAIGVVLWELVTGRRLHPAGNRASTLVEVATKMAPPVPGPLADPIAAALSHTREERPDADSLGRMLQQALRASA